MEDAFIGLLTNAGPMVALVMFFVWADAKRDERNAAEKKELELFIRERLLQLIKQTSEAMETLAKAINNKE